jgi:ureidoglycolate lyase
MRDLAIEEITADAFAPFGLLIPPVRTGEHRVELIEQLQNLRATAKPRLSLAALPAASLPLEAVEMERHVYSSQTFIPISAESYLLLVAPHDRDGDPDVAQLRAFRVPGDVGIHYKADVWHHPMTALDGPARFIVTTFIDGTEEDEEFVPLRETVRIVP